MLLEDLRRRCGRLSVGAVCEQSGFSRERLFRWQKGVRERKPRAPKVLPEALVENAAALVGRYPHLGGRKAQAYMAYHQLGVIGMKAYDTVRRQIRRVLQQGLSGRPRQEGAQAVDYQHVVPSKPGEVWAEDFTELPVAGQVLRVAVVLDVFDHYFLGWSCAPRATAALVSQPVAQALEANEGRPPQQFLLSDNGTQYVSGQHGEVLDCAQIVHRLIPACTPQYNGTVESEMRQIKSVFYNVWERRQRESDGIPDGKKKPLLPAITQALEETFEVLNQEMPRPFLGGVTPADVHLDRHQEAQERVEGYLETARDEPVAPWKRDYWQVLKDGVKPTLMTTRELRTKLAFYGLRPLRRIAKLNLEGVG